MFLLFPQLPPEIRRKIWLATLGPMTLNFTDRSEYTAEDSSNLMESRYMGHVSHPDGSYKLLFSVEPSAAYVACKEPRDFLRYIFAEPVKPDGGLPSWFDPATDTVRFDCGRLRQLSQHPWFTEAQHLWIRLPCGAAEYLSRANDCVIFDEKDRNHHWVADNLGSLKYITFEMMYADEEADWLRDWFSVFAEWFNPPSGLGWEPVSYSARVRCYQADTPEEEWLTPQNYIHLEKQTHIKHYRRAFGVSNWKEMIPNERAICLVNATDEELENPGEFLMKHQYFDEWDLSPVRH
ncbi:hypothetical protein NLG97_g8275 [Lecanicillium saksenae]|uniref:Uncharacterized protein n=1 Tax=Lecanicillium saksenae TaxID=468837 RepID=A0ACC1QJE9_9HYPO|nr:hypothetical protein NLG97_g8275 [Lecanicillium saksenae]